MKVNVDDVVDLERIRTGFTKPTQAESLIFQNCGTDSPHLG